MRTEPELLNEWLDRLAIVLDEIMPNAANLVRDALDLLKEQEEHKTGKWEVKPSNKEQGERDFIWWKCSECGQVIYSESEHDREEFHKYCGRCGAKMT